MCSNRWIWNKMACILHFTLLISSIASIRCNKFFKYTKEEKLKPFVEERSLSKHRLKVPTKLFVIFSFAMDSWPLFQSSSTIASLFLSTWWLHISEVFFYIFHVHQLDINLILRKSKHNHWICCYVKIWDKCHERERRMDMDEHSNLALPNNNK